MSKKTDSQAPRQPVDKTRATYSSPRLTRFGPVQGLTLGSGGSLGDGGVNMNRADMQMMM
ncbi:hypothetical protein F0M18_17295 [Pseudohalioglobus sediminis]|uniref:Uncharacterized protein n=1 Tax=Pseudohalioglobus sediminis TaxID=2606449 RepID=A0A5B0WR85_9GAMM|nr:hypothetical protein [Pseudohalioglobus sediminis]KAA1188958.1 hypothetical protein F0M18_17295 [Pseudohalioglobus sediminis]